MKFILLILLGVMPLSLITSGSMASAQDFEIVVDYSYDTNNFFDTSAKKAGLEAAAARYSRIINSTLSGVTPAGTGTGTSAGWRVGFSHPGTGSSFEVSTATSFATDPLSGAGAADVYGFGGLTSNQWILYAGGRSLSGSTAGVGGTGTGTNFTSTFNDLSGPMHRDVISNTPADTVADLPAWGGSISFDSDGSTAWHFDPTTAASLGTTDLYSIALHEVGHALGLSLSFNQWEAHQSGSAFSGPEALAAYNLDNASSLTSLNTVDASNFHWEDGTYESFIFEAGTPNLVGTVGTGTLQDLLMEPTANFTGTLRRFELTNTDVAALRDLGWSTIAVPEPSTTALIATVFMAVLTTRRRRRRC